MHIPNCMQQRACEVKGAVLIEPVSYLVGLDVPNVLFNINVIWICARDNADITQQPDFASYVFNTIDFTACCIALEVKADLSYSFRSYDAGALEALQNSILELRPSAWESCVPSGSNKRTEFASRVDLAMGRILRFIVRGFRWPSPHLSDIKKRLNIDGDRTCSSYRAIFDVSSMVIRGSQYDQRTYDTVNEASYFQTENNIRAWRDFHVYDHWMMFESGSASLREDVFFLFLGELLQHVDCI